MGKIKKYFNESDLRKIILKHVKFYDKKTYSLKDYECKFIVYLDCKRKEKFKKVNSLSDYLKQLNYFINIIENEQSPEKILNSFISLIYEEEFLNLENVLNERYQCEILGFGIDINLNIVVVDEMFIDERIYREVSLGYKDLIYLKLFETKEYNSLSCNDNYLTFLNVPSNILYLDCEQNLLHSIENIKNLKELVCGNNNFLNLNLLNFRYLCFKNNNFEKLVFNNETEISMDTVKFLKTDSNIINNYNKLYNHIKGNYYYSLNESLIIEKVLNNERRKRIF